MRGGGINTVFRAAGTILHDPSVMAVGCICQDPQAEAQQVNLTYHMDSR